MEIIRWENPPRSVLDEAIDVVNVLSGNPGKWGLVAEGVDSDEASEIVDLLLAVSSSVEYSISGDRNDNKSVYVMVKRVVRGGWNGDR